MKKTLKKLLSDYRKCATWLAGFGGDRYLHLMAGLLIAFIVGCAASGERWSAGLLGVIITFVVGFFKEITDSFTGENGDAIDWLFTIVGGAIGFGLLMLSSL